MTYLRRRRLWYPWLYFGFSALVSTLLPERQGRDGPAFVIVLFTLLIGALLAEVLALRRPRGDRREASLSTRRVTGLVPYWALALNVVAVSVALAKAIGGMADLSWATVRPPKHPLIPAAALGVVVATSLAVALILHLAVRRPPQPRADAAGMFELLFFGCGIVAWSLVTTPIRELPRAVRAG